MTIKVISVKCLPTRMPVTTFIAFWLLMDRFNAPAWLHGVYWTIVGILTLAAGIQIWRQEQKDLPGFGKDA